MSDAPLPELLTSDQVRERFRAELVALLERWDADLEAADCYQGYAECGEDVRMTVTVPSIHDKEGRLLREWTDIDLGRRVP